VFSPTEGLLLQRRPSPLLGGGLLLCALLALLALSLTRLSLPVLLLLGVLLLLQLGWLWPRHVSLRHARAVTALRYDVAGWHVLRRDGSETAATLLPDTWVSTLLTVVRLREAGRWWSLSVILLPDAAAADALRRLRLRLRFSRQRWAAAE